MDRSDPANVPVASALRRLTDQDLEETVSTRLLVVAARLVVSGLMNQPLDIARRTGLLEQLRQQSAEDVQADVAHAIDSALARLPAAPDDGPQMAYSGA